MRQLDQLIQTISGIDKTCELEAFLNSIGEQSIYTYTALVFGSPNTTAIGQLPESLLGCVKEPKFEQCLSKLTKPAWQVNDQGSDSVFNKLNLDNCLLIPSLRGSKKAGGLLLGIVPEPKVIEAIEQLAWYWQLISVYLFDALHKCLPTEPDIVFTPRELECLQWVSEGKTSWEVSQIIGVSERTVNFHIANVMQKTNSSTRQQAVSKFLTTY